MKKIWLIATGEPLPFQDDRLHRVGILARMLADKGDEVNWWTSTFDHQNKKLLFDCDKIIEISKNLKLVLLHCPVLYKKNLSLKRILNHALIGHKFLKLSKMHKKPDIILCSFPTIDLSYASVRYGYQNNVPVIIDVRDLWPDIFLEQVPKFFRQVAKLVLTSYFKRTKKIFQNTYSITAVSEKYLDWALKYAGRERTDNDAVFPLGYEKFHTEQNKQFDCEAYLSEMGIEPSKTNVWFIGTFGRTYDLANVIRAARRLIGHRKDIQFIFTGDGEKMREWRILAKGLKNVIFTGWADKSQLLCLSRIASIGLMAYVKNAPQGLPNKIFEYLSAGIPIISSLEGETKELLEKYGVGRSYLAGDEESFINTLIPLVDSTELRKEMGKRGKILFEERYDTNILYNNLIHFMEKVYNRYSSGAVNTGRIHQSG